MAVDFNSLYDIYNSGDLVLIVGSEVVRMKHYDTTNDQVVQEQDFKSNAVSLNNSEVAPELNTKSSDSFQPKTFEQRAIEIITEQLHPNIPKTFSDTAIKFPKKIINSTRLKGIYLKFKNDDYDYNLIQLIADLPKVQLYIQTSFDTKLIEELENTIEIYVWNHNIREPIYLNKKNGKRKVIYLFGDTNEGISVFEEELIDSLLNLSIINEINKSRKPEQYSFLEYLKDKTLVFIGNNFPDWFMRLMIRTLYNAPVTSKPDKAYIVNDNSRDVPFERYFFDKFKIELIHDYPIEDFLNNLHEAIRSKEPFDDWHFPKRVFISYDRVDSKYANDLKRCLNRKHIDAFLDTTDMGIAEHEKKIKTLIQSPETCIIVCILSTTLMHKNVEESYTKRIEWKTAANKIIANTFLDETEGPNSHPPFIVVPIAIDNFNLYKELLPDFIPANNILSYNLNNEICDLIEAEIKSIKYEFRKSI